MTTVQNILYNVQYLIMLSYSHLQVVALLLLYQPTIEQLVGYLIFYVTIIKSIVLIFK